MGSNNRNNSWLTGLVLVGIGTLLLQNISGIGALLGSGSNEAEPPTKGSSL